MVRLIFAEVALRRYLGAFLYAVLLLASPAPASAQETGGIAGAVVDQSQSVLPGVTVTATEVTTGRQYVAVTDAHGQYGLLNVPAGTYRLEGALSGFTSTVLPALELLVGQRVTVPLVLRLATLEESVTVTGEAPLVDTRSTQLAGNIDRRQMEELPILGRDWMELSMMVKGVTANDVSSKQTPGVARDDQFQLNLDGQQVRQGISLSSFAGQTGLSREAIAEFQIVTNLFDVTQGRSAGVQVQAISRSGTNNLAGTLYGFFRSDKFNDADHVAGEVLPYSSQQVGGSLGGPIVRNRAHYFVTYEYEREPSTIVFQPPGYTQSLSIPMKRTEHSTLARGDVDLSRRDRLMLRYTSWSRLTPFRSGGAHPSQSRREEQSNWALSGSWTRVMSDSVVQELKAGNYHYFLLLEPAAPRSRQSTSYNFPGVSIGTSGNQPEEFWQDAPSVRYDLTVSRNSHELKIGAEHIREWVTGNWLLNNLGNVSFASLPADVEGRFPLDAWDQPSRWDLSGLDSIALFHNRNFARFGPPLPGVRLGRCATEWTTSTEGCGDWSLAIPRPVFAFWIGDTWRITDRFTFNYGVRYDLDWGHAAPPHVKETDLVIDNGLFVEDVGYRNDIRDLNNWSPRVGFNYNVRGNGRFVIRGGSGLSYGQPTVNSAYLVQLQNGQRMLSSQFVNDGRPGWLLNPTRGVTNEDVVEGRVPLPPQNINLYAHDYELPTISTTILGFQRQVGPIMAVDADLVYERGWNLGSQRNSNLFFDPVTGYNLHPTRVGRPRPDFGNISPYQSNGRSDRLNLATSFTRRYRNNFQLGLTYTLMFFGRDTGVGSQGYGGSGDNPFDLDDSFGRSVDFQRHTLRMNALYRLPWDLTVSWAYFFGSGNYFQSTTGLNPFGSGAGSRLRPDGSKIPVRDFKGDALHKLDVRLAKELRFPRDVKLSGIVEVFNLLNHANYGSYTTVEGRDNYGRPTQNIGTAYVPRSGQLGLRLSF
jgi:hypothetical protein